MYGKTQVLKPTHVTDMCENIHPYKHKESKLNGKRSDFGKLQTTTVSQRSFTVMLLIITQNQHRRPSFIFVAGPDVLQTDFHSVASIHRTKYGGMNIFFNI